MRVDLSGRVFSFPRVCACCGREADDQLQVTATRSRGKRVVHTESVTWPIPYCSACLSHAAAWNSALTLFKTVAGIGLVVGSLSLCAAVPVGLVVIAGALVLAFVLQAKRRTTATAECSPQCACPGPAAAYLGWQGTFHSFDLEGRVFAADFMSANLGKLLNVSPQARQLVNARLEEKQAELEGHLARANAELEAEKSRGRAAREQEAQAAASSREQVEYAKWIARIEAGKGPAARRAALDAALGDVARPDLRQRLLLDASRIEVQAALDKADGLKTPAAKLRVLRATLETIRADEVPDELQEQRIRWLEEAIAEVEGDRRATSA